MVKKITNKKEKVKKENIEEKEIDIAEDFEEEEIPERISSEEDKKEKEEVDIEEDYLRQYQYKKVNNIPTIGGILTDPDKGSKAETMKAFLLTQKRIATLIPLSEGSDPKILYSVTLNGYRLDLPTNTYIEIPEQVAEVVRQSNKQTLIALDQFKISGNKVKEDALA